MENAENPFAALLADTSVSSGISKELVEKVFLFTLRKVEASTSAVSILCLADVVTVDSSDHPLMGEDLLAHAIFERLMLINKQDYLVSGITEQNDEHALETEVITYLYNAFKRCAETEMAGNYQPKDYERIRGLIFRNASTCVRQPQLFQEQALSEQWLNIFELNDQSSYVTEFLAQTIQRMLDEDDHLEVLGALKAIFYAVLKEVQTRVSTCNLISIKSNIFTILGYFVNDKRIPQLGEVLIDYSTPNPNAKGSDYVNTLLGQLLCISIMPKNSNGPFEFFNEVSLESQHTDPFLWNLMSEHQNSTFILIKQLLLLCCTTKRKTLQWISHCLHANVARGHLWNNINVSFDQVESQNASDSFMIGLNSTLLRLCAPLCMPTMKILLVDPTYCAVGEGERRQKEVSMVNVSSETCLLPSEENVTRLSAEKFNFVTEVFYLTHKSLELGYRACIEMYVKITREWHNLQTAYQDVAGTNPNNEMAKNLFRMLKDQMQKYLCLRNSLMEPKNDILILKFFEVSAVWLTEITLITEDEYKLAVEKKDFTPKTLQNRKVPVQPSFIPPYLQSVPEIIIDNIVAYLNFSRHFAPGQYIEMYQSSHDAFFKMIILFMGNPKLMVNPHLRAKLAEALEVLLPRNISGSTRNSFMTRVFDDHVDRFKVVRSLLNVFVSIEMTGQSVQFEQKFNYRRPMYAIMEYLWTKEEQVQCFRDLAKEAELNMEAIEPPLFLRFINLLINDAIFLLDESLSNLEQIRTLQEAEARGEWEGLSATEHQQHMSNLHNLGMLARFDNILGRDTINTLKLLTTEIKSIFCHNSMVDRMAAMLNYFLLNLVGPQKEKFKVKDKKEFDFDPAQTVIEICRIYINLSCSDAFCLAISQDGRSYSSKLFSYAENILVRISGGLLIGEIIDFAEKVKKIEAQYKEEQEFIADAPDEYLDPIMSTLMSDPVILPSSNVTVDRSTIARHLLSDQTDPFNRSPLTMDKVKTNVHLKNEIENWIAEKRAPSQANKADN